MKKFTIILTVLFSMTFKISAQIPNNGFEEWTTVGSYEDPAGWATMNAACAGPFYSCTKSTDHYPVAVGNYSIRLENNTSLTQATGAYGMAITDTMAYPFEPAFPIVGNPTNLCGYYKFNSMNNDSMFIRIVLFENGIMLGNNTFITSITTSTWTSFSLPITYASADSATIHFSAFYPSGPTDGPNGNSVLNVDNLSFDNLITSVYEQTSNNRLFNLYPDPSSDNVTLNIVSTKNTDWTLNIYNVTGALVRSEILRQNKHQIKTGNLYSGVYLVQIKSREWTETQKLIIRK